MDLSAALSVSPSLLASTPQESAEQMSKRKDIAETARKFESSFLSIMLQQMFSGVEQSEPFGGGAGEDMFKSFMSEAMANQMTKAGGVGIAHTVQREMLKLQGLT